MKKIISILAALIMCFTLSSCVTEAQAQVDGVYDGNVDISLVITYGTPYYNAEGLLLYYIYRDMYYYPFYDNGWYFRYYSRPLPPRYYRLVPRDFYNHHRQHHPHHHVTPPNRGHHNTRPNGGGTHTQPNTHRNDMMHYGGHRPSIRPNPNNTSRVGIRNTAPRSSTRPHMGVGNRGHFGSRR